MSKIPADPEIVVREPEEDVLGVRYLCDWVVHQERVDRDRRLEREEFVFRSEGETLDGLYDNLARARCHELPFWGETVRIEYGAIRKVVVKKTIDLDVASLIGTDAWQRLDAKQRKLREEIVSRDAAQEERNRQNEIDTMRRLMAKHGAGA